LVDIGNSNVVFGEVPARAVGTGGL
jgi:hypothetical protein